MKALKNITTISLLFGLLVASEVFASAGKIIYSHGDNYARDGEGKQRRLSKNAEIFSGDTLFTSAQGRMQVRFSDGGMVSVYPRSEYKIERFIYTAENEDEQRGFFSLLKGAARQITGLLGKNKRDNFKFSTTVATIGIRGTGFFVQLCQGDCYDAEGNLQPDGMYVKNDTGLISMTNEQGEIMLAQGQSAFAASSDDAPQQIHQPLAAYNVAVNDVETYDFDIGDSVSPTKPIILGRMESVFTVNIIDSLTTTGHVVDSSLGDTITQDTENNITAYDFTNANPLRNFLPAKFDSAGGSLVESGADQNLGVVWNRWTGGYTLTEDGIAMAYTGDIHLIGAAQLSTTLPVDVTVSYQGSAGTAPTFIGPDGTQLTGTQNVAFDINYYSGGGDITNLSVTASFAGSDITAAPPATSGDIIQGNSALVYLDGSCPAALCSVDTQMYGSISINLVGVDAEGAFGSYGLSDWASTTVTGSYLATQTATAPLIPQ